MNTLPPELYAVVGILVITNLSTVGALIVFIFKCGKFVANTENGISKAQESAVRAHKRVDQHETNYHKQNSIKS